MLKFSGFGAGAALSRVFGWSRLRPQIQLYVLQVILDNSLTVLMFTGAGAGSRKKIPWAGAASKQDGSETLRVICVRVYILYTVVPILFFYFRKDLKKGSVPYILHELLSTKLEI